MPDAPCAPTPAVPSAIPTTLTSRWARLKTFLLNLPQDVLTYLKAGADATNRAVEYRLIFFALGCTEIMVLIALDYHATGKLNTVALGTLATLIGVGNISMMHRSDQ